MIIIKIIKIYDNLIAVPPFVENQTITESYRIKEGEKLALKCETSGYPTPKVFWMRNNQQLLLSESDVSSLVIENATKKDAGRYICIATNKAGSTEKDYNVVVMCKCE